MGAVNGLLFLRPATYREAAARFVFSGTTGWALYFMPMQVLRWADMESPIYARLVLGGALIAAFLAWPIAGVAIKASGAFMSRKANEE